MHRYQYTFDFGTGRTHSFAVDLDGPQADPSNAPAWTALDNHQCPNCPLQIDEHRHCPAAVALAEVVDCFAKNDSHERVHVRVVTGARTTEQVVDIQTGLRSLIGLIMPTSGCPVAGRLAGLARHHVPFAEYEETLFRVVGSYLLDQYLAKQAGGEPDWELTGFRALYEELQQLNRAFADRLRTATMSDAGVNAVVALFSLSMLVPMSIDHDLAAMLAGRGLNGGKP